MKNLPRKKEVKICYPADIANTHVTALLKGDPKPEEYFRVKYGKELFPFKSKK
jgi:ABC-type Fe3+ transport system substrate-binding protein